MGDLKPYIDFIITQNCNYRCEYCSQSKSYQDASCEVIEGFLSAIDKLPREFEITISGGEPLLHPHFLELIKKVKNMGFCVAIVSNFTSAVQKYEEIIDILDNKLSFLMFSCHTDSVANLDEYINKALIVKSHTHPDTKMRVCTPLWKDNLNKLKYIEGKLIAADIEFEVQHIRIKNKFIKYSYHQAEYLKEHNAAPNKDLISFAKICHAGAKSAVIYENGEIYRCYSSRVLKSHYLGNVKDGVINLCQSPCACPLLKCTCPKPCSYNMIERRADYINAFINAAWNLEYIVIKKLKNLLRI